MNKALVIGAIIILVVVAGYFLIMNNDSEDAIQNQVEGNSLEIKDFIFSPKTIEINIGDTLTWTNQDSAKHTVTSDSGDELDSALLAKGESYSHTFNVAGEFDYHCTPHPYMNGKIIVK